MARHGDGLYLRGTTWYLDCRINGMRHVIRLGKNISRSVAKEIAQVKRGAILKGEAGIGKKARDLSFDDARKKFELWAMVSKKTGTVMDYKECLRRLAESFSGVRLGVLSPFLVEKHKQQRIQAGARIRANRELAVLKSLFNRCREWQLFEGENPVASVKMHAEGAPPTAPVSGTGRGSPASRPRPRAVAVNHPGRHPLRPPVAVRGFDAPMGRRGPGPPDRDGPGGVCEERPDPFGPVELHGPRHTRTAPATRRVCV
jgi:hypothetical protein